VKLLQNPVNQLVPKDINYVCLRFNRRLSFHSTLATRSIRKAINGSTCIRLIRGNRNFCNFIRSCFGDGCPQVKRNDDVDFNIAGSATVGAELTPLLVKGFAQTLSAEVAVEISPSRAPKRSGRKLRVWFITPPLMQLQFMKKVTAS